MEPASSDPNQADSMVYSPKEEGTMYTRHKSLIDAQSANSPRWKVQEEAPYIMQH